MKLIVGLGNPGREYEGTRHNLGLAVIDAVLKEIPAEARLSKKLLSLTFSWQVQGAVLAKPTTFMNQSGRAVKKLVDYFKISPPDLWIIHDEIDLPLGRIKIQVGGGAAGHHGIESIIKEVGTEDLVRFKLGIGPKPEPARLTRSRAEKDRIITNFVLATFGREEKPAVERTVRNAVETVKLALERGIEETRLSSV